MKAALTSLSWDTVISQPSRLLSRAILCLYVVSGMFRVNRVFRVGQMLDGAVQAVRPFATKHLIVPRL